MSLPINDAWSLKRFRYLFQERNEKGYPNEPQLAATQHAGVVPKSHLDFRTMETITGDLANLKLVEPGDFVISLRSFEGGLEYSAFRGILSPAYSVLQPGQDVHPGFFKHLLKSEGFVQSLGKHKKGIRDGQAVPFATLQDDYLAIPPLNQQERIANFLDDKTARIDALVAEKERLLASVEQLWQSKLSYEMQVPALTGSDSLPAGWTRTSLKRLCLTITTGRTPSGTRDDCFSEDGQLWVTPGDIQGLFVSSSIRRVTDIALSDDEVREYPAGSTLLVGIGATVGNVGHSLYPTSANQQINVLVPLESEVDPVFLTLLVEAHREQVRLAAGAATLPIINQEKTGRIEVAVPALSVQRHLRDKLLAAKGHIELLKFHAMEHIARLREYRSSLISAAVNGQINIENYNNLSA